MPPLCGGVKFNEVFKFTDFTADSIADSIAAQVSSRRSEGAVSACSTPLSQWLVQAGRHRQRALVHTRSFKLAVNVILHFPMHTHSAAAPQPSIASAPQSIMIKWGVAVRLSVARQAAVPFVA